MPNLKFQCLKWFLPLIIACLGQSCIQTKKVVYLEPSSDSDYPFTAVPQEFSYKIKPGDRFSIKIEDPTQAIISSDFKVPEGNNQMQNAFQQIPTVFDYEVDQFGRIAYPLLGSIKVEGLSLNEFRKALLDKCDGVMSNPIIKLYMTNYNVTILGEVNNPGWYQLITNSPTFFDAAGIGGDLTDFANRKEIKIIRKENNQLITTTVDITSPEFIQSPYFYVQPNDVIHIPPLKSKKYTNGNSVPIFLSVITTAITIITLATR